MPRPFYSFTDNRDGSTYKMPWDDVGRTPTPNDLFNFVNEQKNRSVYQKLNEPLSDLPSRVARKIAEPLYRFGEYGGQEGQPKPAGGYDDSLLRQGARLGGSFIEGIGDVGDTMTSPMGLVTTLGGPLARGAAGFGLPTAAKVLGRATQGAGALQFLHGGKTGYEAIQEGDWNKGFQGAAEMGGGALGMKFGMPRLKPTPGGPGTSLRSSANPRPSINPLRLEGGQGFDFTEGEIIPDAPTPQLPGGQRALPPVTNEGLRLPPARTRGGTPPSPPAGPFYGGRAATSTNLSDVIDVSPRARTPSEEAFFNQIPDRYKPQTALSNISDEGLRGQAPYPYVGEAARAEQGFAQPGPSSRLTPGQMRQMGTRFKKKPTVTKAEQEAASLKVGNQPMTSKAWEMLRDLYQKEDGFIDINEILPGIEDTLKGAGIDAREIVNRIKAKTNPIVKEGARRFGGEKFSQDPAGAGKALAQSGWGFLNNAGEPGKKLKRLLSKTRLDTERVFAREAIGGRSQIGDKVGKAIWREHGDEIKSLIDQIEDPIQRDQVDSIIQTQLGRRQPTDSAFKPGFDAVKKIQAATKLSQFPISNLLSYPANYTRGNVGATLRATWDTLTDYKNSLETARKSGALGPLEEEILREVGGPDKGTHLINKLYGIDKSEGAMRTISALAGRSTAKEIFAQLKKNPLDKLARRRLDDLILEDVDGLLGQDKLTPKQLDRASARMAEITQGRAEPIDLPPLWTGNAAVDNVTQFKRYGYSQGRNMKEAFKIDPVRTGAAIMTAFPLVGEVVMDVKAALSGGVKGSRKTIESGRWSAEDVKKEVENALAGRGEGLERYADDLAGSWAFGILLEMVQAGKRGPMGIGAYMGGPTVSDVSQAWSATDTAIRKGNTAPMKRELAGKVPYIGTAFANTIKAPESTPTTNARDSRGSRKRPTRPKRR